MNTLAPAVDVARILGVDPLVLTDANLQLCFNLLDEGVDPQLLAQDIEMVLKEQNKI